jgi:hypothetical protein
MNVSVMSQIKLFSCIFTDFCENCLLILDIAYCTCCTGLPTGTSPQFRPITSYLPSFNYVVFTSAIQIVRILHTANFFHDSENLTIQHLSRENLSKLMIAEQQSESSLNQRDQRWVVHADYWN